jgi:ribonuclease VapC
MTVVFDAEALVAFAFDEPGADVVERYLDEVYHGERDGYVTTVNVAEFRYVAARKTSLDAADAHIASLERMGVAEYGVDELWRPASTLKASYGPALGDAYALAAARELDEADRSVTLLVGADDDYDEFETVDPFASLIERFRDDPA